MKSFGYPSAVRIAFCLAIVVAGFSKVFIRGRFSICVSRRNSQRRTNGVSLDSARIRSRSRRNCRRHDADGTRVRTRRQDSCRMRRPATRDFVFQVRIECRRYSRHARSIRQGVRLSRTRRRAVDVHWAFPPADRKREIKLDNSRSDASAWFNIAVPIRAMWIMKERKELHRGFRR